MRSLALLSLTGFYCTVFPPSVREDSAGIQAEIPLEDGTTGLGIGVASLMLRDAADRWRFGVDAGDGACPTAAEDTWTGPCVAENGTIFEGTLGRSEVGGTRWIGGSWQVEQAAEFEQIALQGSWTSTGSPDEQRSTLDGALTVRTGDPEDPRDQFMPEGVEGALEFTGSWSEAVDVHTVSADLEIVNVGAASVDLRLEQHAGACASGLPDAGSLTVRSGDELAVYSIGGEAACQGCWSWTHNGVGQGQICF